jgi:hypothetical protein
VIAIPKAIRGNAVFIFSFDQGSFSNKIRATRWRVTILLCDSFKECNSARSPIQGCFKIHDGINRLLMLKSTSLAAYLTIG